MMSCQWNLPAALLQDADMNQWGDEQQAVTDELPTSDQPDGAVFQAGCAMHCGMQKPLYGHVSADGGTFMRDAISTCATPASGRNSCCHAVYLYCSSRKPALDLLAN
jgi:hypothetical protein